MGLREAPPSVLPDISPSRGEITLSPMVSLICNVGNGEPASTLPISPLEGEMSGRTE
ncbi:ABC transporter ATP-binding protein, partial [Mesorhizobium sp. M4B.F.Ca.ET.088.02.2.1]